MRWKRRMLPVLLILLLLIAPYPWVINSCAFYPDRVNVPDPRDLPPGIEEVYISTDDGQRIQCYWLARPTSDRVLIYFSGNSGNLSYLIPELMDLADLDINVLGAGYRGFGKSTGRPSEKGIYTDGRAALQNVLEQRGFRKNQVILMGFSIGTTVAVQIAQEHSLGGLILVTPLTSGRDMARIHGYGPLTLFVGKIFDNLSKIDKIRCPLLILHGTSDEVVPLSMGRRIYAAACRPKQMVVIEGGRHNDLADFAPEAYFGAIREFLTELKSSQYDSPALRYDHTVHRRHAAGYGRGRSG
jgi:uncharacterized protein